MPIKQCDAMTEKKTYSSHNPILRLALSLEWVGKYKGWNLAAEEEK